MRVAACQMNSRGDKAANLATALGLLDEAAAGGADLAVLPEYFDYLGTDEGALAAAEPIPGPLSEAIGARARRLGLWVLAGSLHARAADGRCHNASLLFDREGRIAARYDKLHLFDIGLAGQPNYRESATVGGGDQVVTAEIEGLRAGLSVCYDIRFPELYRLHMLAGARLLLVPAAFTQHTGQAHWELLLRARAVENQCFVIAAAQVGESIAGRACFGHSMIVDPWGQVLACRPEGVGVVAATLDLARQEALRAELPALANRRADIYRLGAC
ncbi:carbon-nitrogen hydrolase family protein [Belnapia sp. F-4-1]|uniref:carbon-nitrogen hydrolase family protein n=1 Tax=Belnapia sp. F-4-1 TaxID=1545443 RepID=UPI0005BE4F84|nr:carbon-nitrogen hydrolase family protein [Belnapia sp. F-4-1]